MNKNLELIRQKCIEANPKDYRGIPETDRFWEESVRRFSLADVLLAMNAKSDTPEGIKEISDKYPALVLVGQVVYLWNLHKDDLNEQSEETINFLA